MNKSFQLGLLISIGLGIIFSLAIFSEIMNPVQVDWLLQKKGDVFQHYISWELYRDAPFAWPLGVNKHVGYPVGLPLTFTDSMPIMAMLLKPFSSFLPDRFQYHGIWTLLLFALQGAFGYLLSFHVTRKKTTAVIGAMFFITAPSLLNRLYGHMALSAHWMILAGLYLYLQPLVRRWYLWWALLVAIALATHPYMALMVSSLCAAFWLKQVISLKAVSLKQGGLFVVAMALWCAAVTYVLGYYQTGDAVAVGFGNFSMNLNALWNPFGWSRLIPDSGHGPYQSEGMQYLGFGMILLVVTALVKQVLSKTLLSNIKRNWPLIAVSVGLTILALSNKVLFGKQLIFFYQVGNGHLHDFVETFRSSGRLFWPVYYALFLVGLSVVKPMKYIHASLLLIAVFAIQQYDIYPTLKDLHHYYETPLYQTMLTDPFWEKAANSYQHIAFVPDVATGHYEEIAVFAAKNDMSLNTMYIARPIDGGQEILNQQLADLALGTIDPSYIYIIVDPTQVRVADTLEAQTINGYTIVVSEDF